MDRTPVLLKTPRHHPPSAVEVALLTHEYEILQGLSVPGIPKAYTFLSPGEGCCLVLEDSGGTPLQALLVARRPDIASFLRLSIKLSAILANLHQKDIAHYNLNIRSILIHPRTEDVSLIDFGLAAPASGRTVVALPLPVLHLTYVSPEQTGRMNRTADYRSDFYALGVLLYELLTGVRPVGSDDALELVHWHIARIPRAPTEVAPEIPQALSQIVMKLLEKTPEQRYQSALGLKHDLEICAREWTARRSITPFRLGQHDISDRFLIPHQLYGRARDVEKLLTAFEHACAGPASLVLVSGYAGIGKTSLVQELSKPIARQRGMFIAGKFDQVARNIPYSALIQAFRGLVHQLLTDSEERLALWRTRLSQALGAHGGVLVEIMPEIELILGPQPPPPSLGPTEAQNRLQLVFHNFIGALAGKEHPLVIFLDDLQWADTATLSLLLPLLASPDMQYLLLIGAYRDNEVDPGHPLLRTLSALEAAGARLQRIVLGPLGLPDVTLFLSDTLHSEPTETAQLAQLSLQKTDGNPFFLTQFLKTLRQEELLRFDYGRGRWTFQLEAIAGATLTDNVIDLMTRKIQRLSPQTQRVVTLAACIGNQFDLHTLAIVSQQPLDAAAADLKQALEEGLILPARPSYDVPDTSTATAAAYAFLHDRVQQAAYEFIPVSSKRLVHLTVGRLLLAGRDSSAIEEKLFDIVHHLNLGRELIADESERLGLARLNLQAGQKAKAAAAYQAAAGFLRAGRSLLTPEDWEAEYGLLFGLHVEAAECESLCGQFDTAALLFDLLLDKTATRLDKAQVYNLWINQYENMARYPDAVRVGREGLALFGVAFPESEHEKQAVLDSEVANIQALVAQRPIASLSELPVMTNPDTRMLMQLLTSLWAPAYIADDQLLSCLVSATLVRLSVSHGNTAESAYGYVTHAITVGSGRGDYQSGYAFGQLALQVNEAFNDYPRRAKIHHMFSCFVNVWSQPMASCFPYSREAYRSGLETGDFAYTTYGVFHQSWYALLTSRDLPRFVQEYTPNIALLHKLKAASFVEAQKIILNWARALQGLTVQPLSLADGDFTEHGYVDTYRTDAFFLTFFHVVKLFLSVLFEDYETALETARQARAVVHALHGTIWPVLLDFLHGLSLAGLARLAPEREHDAYLAELAERQEWLSGLAQRCPENFSCWARMLEAERARLSDNALAAMALYEDAIGYARETQNLLNQALASELYARWWQDRRNTTIAAVYLHEAYRCYEAWGATAKLRDLETRYPDLLARVEKPGLPPGPVDLAAFESQETAPLDFSTVVKAAHAIAVEMEPAALLRKLVQMALENAGAQRGFFLQEQDGQLMVMAEGSLENEEVVQVLRSEPVEKRTDFALSVVHYVRKTAESVVVSDASADERFARDPYVIAARPRSVLCVPLVHQNKFSGILYLENNLTTAAFTLQRIRITEVLSAQVAISVENAQLYEEMKQEVAYRRQAEESVRAALVELERLKNQLHAENVYLQEEIRQEHNFEEIVGNSPALLDTLGKLALVAPTDATVLILGETGTGKELLARAIHDRSSRKDRPLVKVNCGAISAGLVESELFGHVKGAFTGALERRTGRFELAHGGSLFLDEVGELPLETQVKLLRVLQDGEFEPVGSSKTVRVDVRIITATTRSLEEMIQTGRFRSDLFYRLNVFPIEAPPLRERQSDIPQLALFFLSRFAKKFGKPLTSLSQETMDLLLDYAWPGNIRELQNLIERAVVVSHGAILSIDSNLLPGALAGAARPTAGAAVRVGRESRPVAPSTTPQQTLSLEEIERRHILSVLAQTAGVIEGQKGAARLLSLHPNTLRSRMKKLGIKRPSHPSA